MRVIQGKYKGRVLEGFHLEGTRPTMDRVKESLFAMLQERVSGATCLDLFAGSGNLGIEALSMGASEVVFVDQNREATKTIQKNLNKLSEVRKVYQLDYQKACLLLQEQKRQFDLIFLDPPYETDYLKKALLLISKYQLLKEDGLVICESASLNRIIYEKDAYTSWKEKRYGDKFVVILRKSFKKLSKEEEVCYNQEEGETDENE